jgi:hypothetical protein
MGDFGANRFVLRITPIVGLQIDPGILNRLKIFRVAGNEGSPKPSRYGGNKAIGEVEHCALPSCGRPDVAAAR